MLNHENVQLRVSAERRTPTKAARKALISMAHFPFCILFLGLIFVFPLAQSEESNASSQRDESPDFFEEYRNDDNGKNEDVRKLLDEFPENQRFVRSLESQFYQIIYPQQLLQRHVKGQGIATRDASKVAELSGRNYKTNHVHRTSYRIKAFSHVFTVDLELNTQLLASNVMALHRKLDGTTEVDHQIERCYYHGTVKDYSGAIAAFRTCNGLAGIIQLGNETLIVSPMAGAEKLAKQPHFVIEAKSFNIHQKCGNKNGYEWRQRERPASYTYMALRSHRRKQARHRFTRDIRSATKYVETALFLDKKFMELRNYSRTRAMYDALQIANIADLYFKTINTRITISYMETWSDKNLINLDKRPPIAMALLNFYETVPRMLQNINKDTSHLITGEHFQGGESGMGVPSSICTHKAAGISVDLNVYEPHLVASTMAHMIGHNLHMNHDDGRQNCYCQDWHGCLMAKNVVGQDNVQPSKFSKCSVDDYHNQLQNDDNTRCLLNSYSTPYTPPVGSGFPTSYRPQPEIPKSRLGSSDLCGNGRLDPGEQCDCGPSSKCDDVDPCCDPRTCQLRMDAECASGPCCDSCKLKPKGTLCRGVQTECDIPEFCDGTHGLCPQNIYMKNGNRCGPNKDSYCFNGVCPTIDEQCKIIWGYGGRAADSACFEHFNVEGVSSGNCGKYKNGSYIKCDRGDIMCGTLQCQMGSEEPVSPNIDQSYSKTVITLQGRNYKCKTMTPLGDRGRGQDYNLVRDGTACGEKLICVNQTCVSLYPFIEQGQCSTNNNALECSGNGVCSNINTCFCDPGWTGQDCSIFDNSSVYSSAYPPLAPPAQQTPPPGKPKEKKEDKVEETPGRNTKHVGQQGSDTVFLVAILVSGVGSVFLVFAFMALCYRRNGSVQKYDAPYMKPIVKKPPQQHLNPIMSGKTEEPPMDLGGRITFGNMPSYSNRGIDPSCREHKMQQLKRQMPPSGSSQSDEETLHSVSPSLIGKQLPIGEDEVVSFIEVPHNNLSKIPEKGILKKPFGLMTPSEKEKWGMDDSHSDNNDVMSQSDNNGDPECQVTEVERTLKSLNGYHEDIIDALKRAASHRAGGHLMGGPQSFSSDELRTVHHDPYPRFPSAASVTPDFTRLKSSHEKLVDSGGEEELVPPCGPIRIRNLEDLIRQLEHNPSRHMSPSGSEEIRMSETEADRHYRLDTSSVTESQGYLRTWRPGLLGGLPGGWGRDPHRIFPGDLEGSTFEGPISSMGSPPFGPVGHLAELLQFASPEDHESILRAAAMLSPDSPSRGRSDMGALAFGYGRYRPPNESVASGSASTSGGRSSDRLISGTTGIDFSDGVDSRHGGAYPEDDLDRGDGGDAADSESDEYQPRPSSALLRSASEEALPVTRYEASRFEAASPPEPYTPPSDEGSIHNDYPSSGTQQPIVGSSVELSQRAAEAISQSRYPEYKH